MVDPMVHTCTCERCGKVIEEASRIDYVSALEKHFRNNHPSVNHSRYVRQQNI